MLDVSALRLINFSCTKKNPRRKTRGGEYIIIFLKKFFSLPSPPKKKKKCEVDVFIFEVSFLNRHI